MTRCSRSPQRLFVALAAVLAGVPLTGGAAAQTGWESRLGTDRYPGTAASRDSDLQRGCGAAFERGYRAGSAAERSRGAAGATSEFRTGLAWNDMRQSEAHERLERAAAELRNALALIRREPSLPRVQGALLQAQEALRRTEDALTWLPMLPDRDGEERYERLRGVGPERASGGWEG